MALRLCCSFRSFTIKVINYGTLQEILINEHHRIRIFHTQKFYLMEIMTHNGVEAVL